MRMFVRAVPGNKRAGAYPSRNAHPLGILMGGEKYNLQFINIERYCQSIFDIFFTLSQCIAY